jgi:aminobenzoyl-glutamate utilization protein B
MPTAFTATWGTGKPVIGFLAEFDALPNLSQKAGVFRQDPITANAPGHGCGHNLYGTSSVTAAIATKVAMEKHKIDGTVKLFGTPAEETLVGKVYMARDGVFNGIDIMITWHPGDMNSVRYYSNLALTSVKFRFKGKSSHASASPEAGRSALDAVELMNVGMNYMREHVPQEARIMYVISKGGDVPNNVPSDAEVWYFIRAPRRVQVDLIWNWMQDVAKGAALMTQTEVSHKILCATWEMLPNKILATVGYANAKIIGAPPFTPEDQQLGAEIVKSLQLDVIGDAYDTTISDPNLAAIFPDIKVNKSSTDYANASWMIPTVVFITATNVKKTPGHSWLLSCQTGMPIATKGGLTASKYMAATAVELLCNPKIISEAKKELEGHLTKTKYYHPIPADMKVPTFKELYGMEPENVPKIPEK